MSNEDEALVILTSLARDLLVETYRELIQDEEFIELAGVRRVATQAGVNTYNAPIGTPITADMEARVRAQTGRGANPAAPGDQAAAPVPNRTAKPSATPPAGRQGRGTPATPVAPVSRPAPIIDAKVVHGHPSAPGAKIYEFDDGTVIVEDSQGNRSKRTKTSVDALKKLGWEAQTPSVSSPSASFKRGDAAFRSVKSITKAKANHRTAIEGYTDKADDVNIALRNDDEPGEDNIKIIDGLRNLLEESLTKDDLTVHRGLSFASVEERDAFLRETFSPGTQFTDKGFSVASADPKIARGDAGDTGILVDIDVPKGSRAAAINEDEKEVLLADRATFRVAGSSVDEDGRPVVKITYIDPLSGKTAVERMEDARRLEKAASRRARFTWKPQDISVDGDEFGGDTGRASETGSENPTTSNNETPKRTNSNAQGPTRGRKPGGAAGPGNGGESTRRNPGTS